MLRARKVDHLQVAGAPVLILLVAESNKGFLKCLAILRFDHRIDVIEIPQSWLRIYLGLEDNTLRAGERHPRIPESCGNACCFDGKALGLVRVKRPLLLDGLPE